MLWIIITNSRFASTNQFKVILASTCTSVDGCCVQESKNTCVLKRSASKVICLM